MKKDILLEEFSSFEIQNNESKKVFGGRRSSAQMIVVGFNGSGANTTMDIGVFNGGVMTATLCGEPDADWGGIKPMGTEVG